MYTGYVYDYTQTAPVTPICFFSNAALNSGVKIISPSLTLSKNTAGSLEFTLLPTNVAYDHFKQLTSIVEISDGQDVVWRGRVISEERDSYNQRKITCEGALNFLMDSVQLPKHVFGSIEHWLMHLLTDNYHDPDDPDPTSYSYCHNHYFTSVDTYKQVRIKYFDPSINLDDSTDWYANWETTYDLVQNVLDAYDIKMEVSYENGITNLSFYKDYPLQYQSQQTIVFGKNLISYTRNWGVEDLATVIIPTGKSFSTDEDRPTTPYTPADLDAVLTVESVNQGSIFVEADPDILARYGRVIKKVEWSDIEFPENLLDLAQDYLTNFQFDKMTIEIEVNDLSVLMTGAEKEANKLRLLGTVHCVSKPHGLDRYFPITEVTIDLNNPGATKFVLGEEKESNKGLSGAMASSNSALKDEINGNKIYTSKIYTDIISRSFEYSTELMHNFANVGHVAFTKNPDDDSQLTGLIISNKVNWSDNDAHLWMWNLGGLAWSEDGGRTFTGVAITNDGQISANFITAGTLNAGIIKAGILSDILGKTEWNLETGVLKAQEFTLETPYPQTPDSQSYLYLSNRPWSINSMYRLSPYSMTDIRVGGYESDQWRLVIGRLFGVTELGTLAANDARFGGTTDAIEHRVVNHSIEKAASALGADYIHVVLRFWIMSNLYGDQVEPAMNDDSTHYNIRWIYQYDLNVGEDVDANVMGSGWVPLTIQKNYVNVVFDDERQVLWNTKNFTLNDMVNADESHYRVEFKIEEGGFNRQDSHYGLYSVGWYTESVPNPEAYPLFFKQGYLRGGSNTLGDNGTFILSTRNSGEIFGVDHQGTLTIAGETRSDWRMTIGNCFGVTEAGYLYSIDGYFQRAFVDGTFSTQNIITPKIQGTRYGEISFSGKAAEAATVHYDRVAILRITKLETTPNYYYNVTVMAAIEDQGSGRQLNSNVDVEFYLGFWGYGNNISASNWNLYMGQTFGWKRAGLNPSTGDGFYRVQYSNPFKMTIPYNIGSGSVTKTFQVYDSRTVYAFSAVMFAAHYDNVKDNGAANPQFVPMQVSLPNQGWSDRMKVADYYPQQGGLDAITVSNSLIPSSNGSVILGGVGNLWKQVYAQNATISSSARIKKKEITALPDNFDIFFDQLKSVSYRWKHDEDVKRHCGFILDEVGYALDAAGIDKEEFAGYVQFDPKDHLSDGGLRYEEFIAINTDQIQKLKKRVSELETLVEELERERNED